MQKKAMGYMLVANDYLGQQTAQDKVGGGGLAPTEAAATLQ